MRLLLTLALTVAAVSLVVEATRRRGLLPPRLRLDPDALPQDRREVFVRWLLSVVVLGFVLLSSVAAPVGAFGLDVAPDLENLRFSQLFLLHGMFAVALVSLYVLGFLPHGAQRTSLLAQIGLRAQSVGRELLIGAGAGLAIWFLVILLLLLLSALISLFGGLEALPQEPPPMVAWIGGLSLLARVAVSLSAGFFEEAFFRGLLQPRVGIGASTAFFALAHLSYDQPLMLVGVTVLSLLFAWLVVWRQSIWAAIAAHAVFDLIQLVVVIPLVTGALEGAAPTTVWLGALSLLAPV